jgi:quercetin dioxygenase-like cupin family protein
MEWEEADGVGIRYAVFLAGTVVPQHSHEYDHISLVPFGQGEVWVDGAKLRDYEGPCALVIERGKKHEFRIFTKTMLVCIHNTSRGGGIEVRDEHQIVEK